MKRLFLLLFCFIFYSCAYLLDDHTLQENLQLERCPIHEIIIRAHDLDTEPFNDYIERVYLELLTYNRTEDIIALLSAIQDRMNDAQKVKLIRLGFSYSYEFGIKNRIVVNQILTKGILSVKSKELEKVASLQHLIKWNNYNIQETIHQMRNTVAWLRSIKFVDYAFFEVDESLIFALTDKHMLQKKVYKEILLLHPSVDNPKVLKMGNKNQIPKDIKKDLKDYGYEFHECTFLSDFLLW